MSGPHVGGETRALVVSRDSSVCYFLFVLVLGQGGSTERVLHPGVFDIIERDLVLSLIFCVLNLDPSDRELVM